MAVLSRTRSKHRTFFNRKSRLRTSLSKHIGWNGLKELGQRSLANHGRRVIDREIWVSVDDLVQIEVNSRSRAIIIIEINIVSHVLIIVEIVMLMDIEIFG